MKTIRFWLSAAAVVCSAHLFAAGTAPLRPVVPDRAGATVKGVVYDGTSPVAGVPVSDGYEVTTTDRQGRYWLDSRKRNGYVFITIPSGYEVPVQGVVPQFWASLGEPADRVEQHDFRLEKADNEDHAMIVITDIHLANIHNDKELFCTTFLPGIRRTVAACGKKPVYTLSLGDMSFDLYWYDYRYGIADYRKTLQAVRYPTPVFHVIGNHDHDGAAPYTDSTDFVASGPFRKTFGPNYYSFNIGRVHYVVLDDIVYKNQPGGKKGGNIAGRRNYEVCVTPEQLDWLRRDLALVSDKSAPVVVAMHAPVYRYEGVSAKVAGRFTDPRDGEELTRCFDGFEQVHYLSGHTHRNNTVRHDVHKNVIDHNIAAVCGNWWRSASDGFQSLSPDGSPAGYAVFDVSGETVSWRYTGTADGPGRQFRAYDMNEVRRYYAGSQPAAEFLSRYPLREDFRRMEENVVYINVWGWEPAWTVSVTENGRELEVERRVADDPLYTVLNDIPEVLSSAQHLKNQDKPNKVHIFSVKAASPASTLKIKVRDAFGRVYTEKMVRPKAFGLQAD